MNRKDFVKACTLLGLSMPLNGFSTVRSAHKGSKPCKVVIVGAGAAGLSAGHLLKQRGVDFTILEAASQYGGRMKVDTSFADFPIPLGAEWISSVNMDFSTVADNEKVLQHMKTVGYLPNEEYWLWANNKLLRNTLDTFNDKKFIGGSWLDLFKTFVVPEIEDNIEYNTKVTSIEYSKEKVLLKGDQREFVADQIILTVPFSILKSEEISFCPPLPTQKLDALDEVVYWSGFKAFFEFEQKFYPAFVDYVIRPVTDGQVSLYDAAWGQESNKFILGLFAVGDPAKKYGEMTGHEFKTHFLEELDRIFEGNATKHYIKHITQNWGKEPFSKGAYVSDFTEPKIIYNLSKPIDGKIYFAGDAYTDGSDWGNVHNAIDSAKQCIEMMVKDN